MREPAIALTDADIRPAFRLRLLAEHTRELDTVVIEELGLCRGQVRVDLAVVNGLLHGYEIKSDRDSLRRLSGQADLYSRVLDRATLVVGSRHLTEALDVVPAWWGVVQFQPTAKAPRFKVVRRASKNQQRQPRYLVELLWLDSAMALLNQRDAATGVRGKPRRLVWDRICERFDLDEIAAAVRAQLKARSATPIPQPPS